MEDRAFLDAVATFERGAMREASPADICAIYKQYKPILEKLIPLIRAIPLIGKGVAAALEALKGALDAYCPTSGPLREARPGTSASEADFLRALSAFDPALHESRAEAVDLCAVYAKVKPVLEPIIPFLALIPGYGTAIAAGLTLLLTAMGKLCPTPA